MTVTNHIEVGSSLHVSLFEDSVCSVVPSMSNHPSA
jgi:hypothetical protein